MVPFIDDVASHEKSAAVAGRLGGIDAQGGATGGGKHGPTRPMTAGFVRQMRTSKLDVTLSINL